MVDAKERIVKCYRCCRENKRQFLKGVKDVSKKRELGKADENISDAAADAFHL
jgi:hypothetical protein